MTEQEFDTAWLAGLSQRERHQLVRLVMGSAEQHLVERVTLEDGRDYARAGTGPHRHSLIWQLLPAQVADDDPGWADYVDDESGETRRMIRIHGPFDVAGQHCSDGFLTADGGSWPARPAAAENHLPAGHSPAKGKKR